MTAAYCGEGQRHPIQHSSKSPLHWWGLCQWIASRSTEMPMGLCASLSYVSEPLGLGFPRGLSHGDRWGTSRRHPQSADPRSSRRLWPLPWYHSCRPAQRGILSRQKRELGWRLQCVGVLRERNRVGVPRNNDWGGKRAAWKDESLWWVLRGVIPRPFQCWHDGCTDRLHSLAFAVSTSGPNF